MQTVLEAVLGPAAAPQGFRSNEWAARVHSSNLRNYTPRQAAHDLKKLRGKNLVRKIDNSRRYEPVPEGLQHMAALLILREKVLKPVYFSFGGLKRHTNSIACSTCRRFEVSDISFLHTGIIKHIWLLSHGRLQPVGSPRIVLHIKPIQILEQVPDSDL